MSASPGGMDGDGPPHKSSFSHSSFSWSKSSFKKCSGGTMDEEQQPKSSFNQCSGGTMDDGQPKSSFITSNSISGAGLSLKKADLLGKSLPKISAEPKSEDDVTQIPADPGSQVGQPSGIVDNTKSDPGKALLQTGVTPKNQMVPKSTEEKVPLPPADPDAQAGQAQNINNNVKINNCDHEIAVLQAKTLLDFSPTTAAGSKINKMGTAAGSKTIENPNKLDDNIEGQHQPTSTPDTQIETTSSQKQGEPLAKFYLEGSDIADASISSNKIDKMEINNQQKHQLTPTSTSIVQSPHFKMQGGPIVNFCLTDKNIAAKNDSIKNQMNTFDASEQHQLTPDTDKRSPNIQLQAGATPNFGQNQNLDPLWTKAQLSASTSENKNDVQIIQQTQQNIKTSQSNAQLINHDTLKAFLQTGVLEDFFLSRPDLVEQIINMQNEMGASPLNEQHKSALASNAGNSEQQTMLRESPPNSFESTKTSKVSREVDSIPDFEVIYKPLSVKAMHNSEIKCEQQQAHVQHKNTVKIRRGPKLIVASGPSNVAADLKPDFDLQQNDVSTIIQTSNLSDAQASLQSPYMVEFSKNSDEAKQSSNVNDGVDTTIDFGLRQSTSEPNQATDTVISSDGIKLPIKTESPTIVTDQLSSTVDSTNKTQEHQNIEQNVHQNVEVGIVHVGTDKQNGTKAPAMVLQRITSSKKRHKKEKKPKTNVPSSEVDQIAAESEFQTKNQSKLVQLNLDSAGTSLSMDSAPQQVNECINDTLQPDLIEKALTTEYQPLSDDKSGQQSLMTNTHAHIDGVSNTQSDKNIKSQYSQSTYKNGAQSAAALACNKDKENFEVQLSQVCSTKQIMVHMLRVNQQPAQPNKTRTGAALVRELLRWGHDPQSASSPDLGELAEEVKEQLTTDGFIDQLLNARRDVLDTPIALSTPQGYENPAIIAQRIIDVYCSSPLTATTSSRAQANYSLNAHSPADVTHDNTQWADQPINNLPRVNLYYYNECLEQLQQGKDYWDFPQAPEPEEMIEFMELNRGALQRALGAQGLQQLLAHLRLVKKLQMKTNANGAQQSVMHGRPYDSRAASKLIGQQQPFGSDISQSNVDEQLKQFDYIVDCVDIMQHQNGAYTDFKNPPPPKDMIDTIQRSRRDLSYVAGAKQIEELLMHLTVMDKYKNKQPQQQQQQNTFNQRSKLSSTMNCDRDDRASLDRTIESNGPYNPNNSFTHSSTARNNQHHRRTPSPYRPSSHRHSRSPTHSDHEPVFPELPEHMGLHEYKTLGRRLTEREMRNVMNIDNQKVNALYKYRYSDEDPADIKHNIETWDAFLKRVIKYWRTRGFGYAEQYCLLLPFHLYKAAQAIYDDIDQQDDWEHVCKHMEKAVNQNVTEHDTKARMRQLNWTYEQQPKKFIADARALIQLQKEIVPKSSQSKHLAAFIWDHMDEKVSRVLQSRKIVYDDLCQLEAEMTALHNQFMRLDSHEKSAILKLPGHIDNPEVAVSLQKNDSKDRKQESIRQSDTGNHSGCRRCRTYDHFWKDCPNKQQVDSGRYQEQGNRNLKDSQKLSGHWHKYATGSNAQPLGNAANSGERSDFEQVICHRCKQKGHMIKNCPLLARTNHLLIEDHDQPSQHQRDPYELYMMDIPAKEIPDTADIMLPDAPRHVVLPKYDIMVGTYKMNALWDSGSESCILPKRILDEIQDSIGVDDFEMRPSEMVVTAPYSPHGKGLAIKTEITLPVRVNRYIQNVAFMVDETDSIDCVLMGAGAYQIMSKHDKWIVPTDRQPKVGSKEIIVAMTGMNDKSGQVCAARSSNQIHSKVPLTDSKSVHKRKRHRRHKRKHKKAWPVQVTFDCKQKPCSVVPTPTVIKGPDKGSGQQKHC